MSRGRRAEMWSLFEGLRLPVIVAPMFLISGPDLVVEACRAGVVGSFPTSNCRTVEELDRWASEIVDRLAGASKAGELVAPWAANLVTNSKNARLAADLEVVARYRPPIVITALGSPRPVMEVVQGYGGLVIADVIDLRLARKAVEAGADGLVCVSAGAGGHTGHLSPFAFVSAVREFFDGLVVVGGGISDGAGIAGAIAAGADLAYLGTRFLASSESLAAPAYKQMVVDHGPDDLVVSKAVTGVAASWLRPSLIAAGLDPETQGARGPGAVYTPSAGAHKRWRDIWAAGQGLQYVRAVEDTHTIVDSLSDEFQRAVNRFEVLVPRARI